MPVILKNPRVVVWGFKLRAPTGVLADVVLVAQRGSDMPCALLTPWGAYVGTVRTDAECIWWKDPAPSILTQDAVERAVWPDRD